MATLRDYQIAAIARLRTSLRRPCDGAHVRRVCLVMPTGAGKTIVCAEIIRLALERGGRALFLAHRAELVDQAVAKLDDLGVRAGALSASARSAASDAPVQVATVQTLLARDLRPPATVIIFDEAHHAAAQQWRTVLDAYPGAVVIGPTATPERGDGRGLGEIFQDIVIGVRVRQLVAAGHLVPARIVSPAAQLRTGQIAQRPVDAYLQHARGRRAICFSPSVRLAEEHAADFRALGIMAVAVTEDTPWQERRAMFDGLRSGDVQVLCNVYVACLDAQTEILTSAGWTGIDAMTLDHEVANWDRGSVTFEKPSEIARRMLGENEIMVTLKSNRIDVRVTDTHRMLYRTTDHGEFLKCSAAELIGRRVRLPVSGQAEPLPVERPHITERKGTRAARIRSQVYWLTKRDGMERKAARVEAARRVDLADSHVHKHPSQLSVAECGLIGFWVGDGSRCALRRGGIEWTISQSVVNPKIVDWIDRTIADCGVDVLRKYRTYSSGKSDNHHIRWSFPRGTGGGSQERIGLFPIEPYLDKHGSPLLWGLSEEQFDAFIFGLWMADGDHLDGSTPDAQRSRRINNHDKALLDRLQAIAVVRGYGARVLSAGPSRDPRHAPMWILCLRKKSAFHMGNATMQEDRLWSPERVWCVKTRTKNIITRRNGTVTVMGNTEGFDVPAVDCIILARGIGTDGGYIQMVGRALRPAPEKTDALILDLQGASHAHGHPEDDRQYSLHGRGIRKADSTDGVDQPYCRVCGAPIKAGETCSECGTAPREIIQRVTGAALVPYASKRREPPDKRAETLARWIAAGRARGWKPTAALAKYRAVYGAWPDAVVRRAAEVGR